MTFSVDGREVPGGKYHSFGHMKFRSLPKGSGAEVINTAGDSRFTLYPGQRMIIDKYGNMSPPLPEEGLTEVRYKIVSH